ncbi:MAG: hypothetical protein ACRDSK_10350 [Actinophytocola sp.]|uniref:hypothetical protein n=1 Tax=Actinophytocola sp. TaxID=1872138 RepID=UPI003D6B929D
MNPPALLRAAVLALTLGLMAACAEGRACTLIAAVPGVVVEVDPAVAAKVSAGTLELCWAGHCRTERVELGSGGGAFVQVLDLPETEVTATVRLNGPSGNVVDQTLTVAAEPTYPNGPDCGGSAAQGRLLVDADGTVR